MTDDFTDILGGDADVIHGVTGDRGMTPEMVFAEEYVRNGGKAMLACNKAGIVDPRYPMEIVARRTLARPEIQDLIAVARKYIDQRRDGLVYSRELMLDELQRIHEKAVEDGQYSSAISAVKTQAQLLGYLDQTINVNHTVSARDLPLAELRRMVSEGMPQEALPVMSVSADRAVIEGAVIDGEV